MPPSDPQQQLLATSSSFSDWTCFFSSRIIKIDKTWLLIQFYIFCFNYQHFNGILQSNVSSFCFLSLLLIFVFRLRVLVQKASGCVLSSVEHAHSGAGVSMSHSNNILKPIFMWTALQLCNRISRFVWLLSWQPAHWTEQRPFYENAL